MLRRLLILAAIPLIFAGGCAAARSGAPAGVPVAAVLSGVHGRPGVLNPDVTIIPDEKSLQDIIGALYTGVLGGPPPGAAAGVDLDRQTGVLVEMGRKNTGGYRIRLSDGPARVEKGVLVLAVHWEEPSEGAMVTQSLTSPWLLVRVDGRNFTKVRVIDMSGRVRISGE